MDVCMADHAPTCAAGMQVAMHAAAPAVRLFVGGSGTRVGGRRFTLDGDREFSAAHPAHREVRDPWRTRVMLDSGAFTDKPERRLSPAQALVRQLRWETATAKCWNVPGWQVECLVSYDRLIDETWVNGTRHKRRWSVVAADAAVAETVDAAQYLANQRARLAPRTLILSCQGVDAAQYLACTRAVLAHATTRDGIGLGGWCILGRFRSWLPTFWATCWRVLPEIAAANIRQVHIFGVLYEPALAGLLWLADAHGLRLSTDSSAPVLSASYTTPAGRKKAGARADTWEGNVAWWQQRLATLRDSPYYRRPPRVPAVRQAQLFA